MPELAARNPTPPNFDRVARLYRWAEYLALGTLLQKVRLHHLPRLPTTGNALVLGDGDGRFTAHLLRHNPHLHVTVIDSSSVMLQLLTKRCHFAKNRLHTHHADLRQLKNLLPSLPGSNLVVTHFVLDCLVEPDVATLAQTLQHHAAPGARWLVSDFAVPPKQPWRLLGAAYIRLLYRAFRALTGLQVQRLPAIAPTLAAAGWRSRTRHTWLFGLLFSELYESSLPGFSAAHATAPRAPSSTHT